ncbi:protein suppressor 2 of zeste-like [Amphibalanus amphitrite]|uniref:protein suppressor 2 of zeste-like n=1 Tax=Amphibalanus amphitrite TaxID=1232801 RepID=UPI001C91E9AF|nr:protein suppressor 2 of zeste-like [Amphibalanus amphitrite]
MSPGSDDGAQPPCPRSPSPPRYAALGGDSYMSRSRHWGPNDSRLPPTPPATSFLRRVLRRLAWSTLPGRFLAGKLLLCLPTHRDPELPSWAKGDVTSHVPHVFTPDEPLQLRLAMFDAESRCDEDSTEQERSAAGVPGGAPPVRYLRCQAGTPLTVLQKLIRNKFQLASSIQVQLIHDGRILPPDITLMDVGYMYRPAEGSTIGISFRLVKQQKRPAKPTVHASEEEPVVKRAKTEGESMDACNDKDSVASETEQKTANDIPKTDKTVEEQEQLSVACDEEKPIVQIAATVSDDVDKEPVPETSASEQDSGIFDSIGDDRSPRTGVESGDEEMLDVSNEDKEKEPSTPTPATTTAVAGTIKQQKDESGCQQGNTAILQEIDLNRQQGNVERDQVKNILSALGSSNHGHNPVSRSEETGSTTAKMKTDERGKEDNHEESGGTQNTAAPQSEDPGPRRPSVLERMFDPDDEEPTSPQIVEDIIASLDAEDCEGDDSVPTVTHLAQIPRTDTALGLVQRPVTIAIPRPIVHRLVNPISPLARVPAQTQVAKPTNSMVTDESKLTPSQASPVPTHPDVSMKADVSHTSSVVTSAPREDVMQPPSEDIPQPSAHRVEDSDADKTKEKVDASSVVRTDRSTDGSRQSHANKSHKDVPSNPGEKKHEQNLSTPNASRSSRESPKSVKGLSDGTGCTSSAQAAPSALITTPQGNSTADKKASTATSTKSEVRSCAEDGRAPKTSHFHKDKEGEARPLSLKATGGVVKTLLQPDRKCLSNATSSISQSNRGSVGSTGKLELTRKDVRHEAVSAKSETNAISKTVTPVKDSRSDVATAPQESNASSIGKKVRVDDRNFETADSPKPVNMLKKESDSLKKHVERSEKRSHLLSKSLATSGSRPGAEALTATSAAIRGSTAIAAGVREGEVIIERVPNLFVQASSAQPEKTESSSGSAPMTSPARSKVDCSVQTMPVAKAGAGKDASGSATPPKSQTSDTEAASSKFSQEKRPASVPQSVSSERKDPASCGRRVSTGDSQVRRPPVSNAHTKVPSLVDIHSRKLSDGDQQLAKQSVNDLPQSKPANDKATEKAFTGASNLARQELERQQAKFFGVVPKPADNLDPEAALNRIRSEKPQPTGQLAYATHHSSGVLKVPDISNRTAVSKAHTKTASNKHHKSSKAEHDKKLNMSYTLWKNMKTAAKTAAADSRTAGQMSHPVTAPSKRDATPSANTPLDLTTHVRKTVAADSTSMLAKTPSPPPKPKPAKHKSAKAQGTQTIHSIVSSLASRQHISLSPITSMAGSAHKAPSRSRAPTPRPQSPYLSSHLPMPMPVPMPEYSFSSGLFTPPLHVSTTLASQLSYDMAMRNLLTHMAMAQGGMVRPPPHMYPTHPMFPPLPKGHEFHPMSDPSLLRRQSEARMGASAKKASPTAGTTAPPLRTPTALTSASIQHMEDLTRTVGKRKDPERHSVTPTQIPSGDKIC